MIGELGRFSIGAVITAALVAAAHRPHSIQEILDPRLEVENALRPRLKNKEFAQWAKTKRLNGIRD